MRGVVIVMIMQLQKAFSSCSSANALNVKCIEIEKQQGQTSSIILRCSTTETENGCNGLLAPTDYENRYYEKLECVVNCRPVQRLVSCHREMVTTTLETEVIQHIKGG